MEVKSSGAIIIMTPELRKYYFAWHKKSEKLIKKLVRKFK